MPLVYILHSQKTQKFYTGFTHLTAEERLEQHLNKYYSGKFTEKITDWEIFLLIECTSDKHAMKIEKHIKKMKSSIYIRNLKKYPDMMQALIAKYQDSSSEPR
jgi:putative endonuclease